MKTISKTKMSKMSKAKTSKTKLSKLMKSKSKSKSTKSKMPRYSMGQKLWKQFHAGPFEGTIVRCPTPDRQSYLVSYADGDSEEMHESLVTFLLGSAKKKKKKKMAVPKKKKKMDVPMSSTSPSPSSKRKRESPATPKRKKHSGIYVRGIFMDYPWDLLPGDPHLDSAMVQRLRKVGCDSRDWILLARRVYVEFLIKLKDQKQSRPKPIEPLGWLPKSKRAKMRKNGEILHDKVIAPLRRKATRSKHKLPKSPRDGWVGWFPRDKHRAENAGHIMLRTPHQNDTQVEKTVYRLRDLYGIKSAATILFPPEVKKRRHSFYSLTKLYGDAMGPGTGYGLVFNYKKASDMILFSLLCTVLGRAPNTIDEWLSVRGIGLKCAHVCMFEGCNEVTGIPVDIHMWRIYSHLGWTSEMATYNCEKSTREIESWFPHKYWGEMNEIYAGLGQLLQDANHRLSVQKKMRALAKATKNAEVMRMTEVILAIPEYNDK